MHGYSLIHGNASPSNHTRANPHTDKAHMPVGGERNSISCDLSLSANRIYNRVIDEMLTHRNHIRPCVIQMSIYGVCHIMVHCFEAVFRFVENKSSKQTFRIKCDGNICQRIKLYIVYPESTESQGYDYVRSNKAVTSEKLFFHSNIKCMCDGEIL